MRTLNTNEITNVTGGFQLTNREIELSGALLGTTIGTFVGGALGIGPLGANYTFVFNVLNTIAGGCLGAFAGFCLGVTIAQTYITHARNEGQ